MEKEQNCGTFTIKDLKPALPETVYNCNGCPLEKGSALCYHQMIHSDNHCQKYLTNSNK